MKKILDNSSESRKALYLFLSSTDCRISEALQLRKQDLELDKHPRIMVVIAGKYTKTKKPRRTFVTKEAQKYLMPILKKIKDDDLIFGTNEDKRKAKHNEEDHFTRMRIRAGLHDLRYDNSIHKITLHSFRRWFITKCNRVDPDTGRHAIPMVPFLSQNRQNQAQFMPFVDHNSDKRYPNGSLESQFFWKPLSETFADYSNHPESKSSGETGLLKRLRIRISKSSINHIGKESNNLDESNTAGISSEAYTKYENLAEKILSIRTRDAWKIGVSRSNLISLQKKIRCKTDGVLKLHKKTIKKIISGSIMAREGDVI